MAYFETKGIAVGYGKKPILSCLNISMEKGQILAIIGPNGSGKSTILKTLSGQIPAISGSVIVDGSDALYCGDRQRAQRMAVMLTDRVSAELTTCYEIIAMGRFPYTGTFGRLSEEDQQAVNEAIEMVGCQELANRDFATLSDGQKQRVLLARAICQDTEILLLDEPTAYLDIRYKLEFLDILRRLAKEKFRTIIMAIHEIDLACKAADRLLCIDETGVRAFGEPDEVISDGFIDVLYGMPKGTYLPVTGSVELPRVAGDPEVFVIGGGGCAAPIYRRLRRQGIPFSAGILAENDVDYYIAKQLAVRVISIPAFSEVPQDVAKAAKDELLKIGKVIIV